MTDSATGPVSNLLHIRIFRVNAARRMAGALDALVYGIQNRFEKGDQNPSVVCAHLCLSVYPMLYGICRFMLIPMLIQICRLPLRKLRDFPLLSCHSQKWKIVIIAGGLYLLRL